MLPLKRGFRDSQIVIITNFVVVSSVGIKRVVCIIIIIIIIIIIVVVIIIIVVVVVVIIVIIIIIQKNKPWKYYQYKNTLVEKHTRMTFTLHMYSACTLNRPIKKICIPVYASNATRREH